MGADLIYKVVFDKADGAHDAMRKALRRGVAMTFHHDAVNSAEEGARVLSVMKLGP